MRLICRAAVVLALWAAGPVRAQPLRFDCIGLAEGLPDLTVYDVRQDRRGFLWLATEGGLVRYDGYTFTTYEFNPSDPHTLSTNVLSALYEDRRGMLWVGTNRGGINRLDPLTGRVTRYAVSDPGARISQIEEDGRGGLWARDARQERARGFFHLPPDAPAFAWVPLPDSLFAPGVPPLLTRGASLWWAQGADRLYRHDLFGGGRSYSLDAGTAGAGAILSLSEDQEGMIWVRTAELLRRLDPGTGRVTSYAVPGPVEAPALARALVYREGTLWSASGAGLLVVRLEEGTRTWYRNVPNDPRSLTTDALTRLHADRSGVIWVGLVNGGLCRVAPRQQQFRHYYHVRGLPGALAGAGVFAVAEDREGTLLVSTAAGGVQRFEEHTGTFHPEDVDWRMPAGTGPPRVKAMHVDRNGGRWYGTWGNGLYHVPAEGGRVRHYRFAPDREAQAMRVLFEDRAGSLWVGTEAGVWRHDRTRDRFDPFPLVDADGDTLPGTAVWSIIQDRRGRIWIGSYGSGLFVFDPATARLRRYRHHAADPRSLSSDNIAVVHEDRQRRLWVGTYGGGLNRWEPETDTFVRLTPREGFPNPYVHGILEDRSGDLWFSTSSGLVAYRPATGAVRTYRAQDGLQSDRFSPGVYLARRDGSFVFGGLNGFNWFDPQEVVDSPYRPPVVVTTFSVRGRRLSLDSLLAHAGEVRIPWAANEFTFELAALDFTAPERNQYAHQLGGYDDGWRYTGTQRFGSYTNLDPGRYVLRVKAAGSAGLWSEEERHIPLYIVPPFWMTAWFRGMAGLAAVLLVVTAVRYAATRKLRRQLQQLEVERRLQLERERISRDLHDHVGAQLTYIIASLDLNTRQLEPLGAVAQQRQLQGLRHHVRTTMRQLRETIWALRQEAVTVQGLVERLESYAAQQLGDLGEPRLHLAAAVEVDVALSPSRALNVFRIAQEALANALKHARAQNLHVYLGTEGAAQLVLQIEDDGVGLPASSCPAGGGGFGMVNMQRRAEELKGTLAVVPRPGGGTRVRLVAPL